jgi:hypothetical protein
MMCAVMFGHHQFTPARRRAWVVHAASSFVGLLLLLAPGVRGDDKRCEDRLGADCRSVRGKGEQECLPCATMATTQHPDCQGVFNPMGHGGSQLQEEPPAFVNEFMLTNGGTSTLCCDSSMVVWPALHDDVCALQCQAVLSKWHWLWITESYLWCHLTHYQ